MDTETGVDYETVPRSIASNISWLTAANFAVKPAWFVFITYVCVRQIGVAQYGTMTAALALMSICDGVFSLGTNQYTIREIARSKEYISSYFSNFFSLRIVTSIIALGVGLIIHTVLLESGFLLIATSSGAYVIARSLTEYSRSFYRATEDFRTDALSTVIEKVFVIVVGSAFVFTRPSTESLLFGMNRRDAICPRCKLDLDPQTIYLHLATNSFKLTLYAKIFRRPYLLDLPQYLF